MSDASVQEMGWIFKGSDVSAGSTMRSLGQGLQALDTKAAAVSASFGASLKKIGAAIDNEAVGKLKEWTGGGTEFFSDTRAAAADFGKGIAEASTLIDESAFPVERMRSIVMDLTKTYGGTTTDQARALYQTISAGITDSAKATELLRVANEFAVGGVTSSTNAVNLLTNTLNAFASSGVTARQVADSAFTAIRAGKTTAQELADSMGRLAPTASAVGVSVNEMFAAVSSLTIQGIATTEAVSGLKAGLANIMKPSHDAQQEASRLGIKFSAAALRSQGFALFLDKITSSAKFNKDSIIKLFGSVEALNSMMALTANGGATFKGILGDMAKGAGSSAEAFGKMANTAWFRGQQRQGLLEVLKIQVGEAIAPLGALFEKLKSLTLDLWQSISPGAQRWIIQAGYILTATLGVAAGIMGLKIAFGLLASIISGTFLVAAPMLALLGGGALLVTGMGTNLGKLRLVFDGLTSAFREGGFSGALRDELNKAENQGIKGFVVGTYVALQRVGNFFEHVWGGLQAGLEAAKPTFVELGRAANQLGVALGLFSANDIGSSIGSWNSWGDAGHKVGKALASIATTLAEGLTASMQVLGGLVGSVRANWQDWKPLVETTSTSLKATADALRDINAQLGLTNAGAKQSGESWETLGGAVSFVVLNLRKGIEWLSAPLRQFMGAFVSVASVVSSLIRGLWNVLAGLGEFWAGAFTLNWTRAAEGLTRVFASFAFGVLQALLGLVRGSLKALSVPLSLIGKGALADQWGAELGRIQGNLMGSALGRTAMGTTATPKAAMPVSWAAGYTDDAASINALGMAPLGAPGSAEWRETMPALADGQSSREQMTKLEEQLASLNENLATGLSATKSTSETIVLQVDGEKMAEVTREKNRQYAVTGWYSMVPGEDG